MCEVTLQDGLLDGAYRNVISGYENLIHTRVGIFNHNNYRKVETLRVESQSKRRLLGGMNYSCTYT